MAFVTTSAGDRYNLGYNMVPKVAAGSYTPKLGDLVVFDTATQNGVKLPAAAGSAGSGPQGIVEVINPAGLLTVATFVSGAEIELPYTGGLAVGNRISVNATPQTHGTTLDRSIVTVDNTNGNPTSTVIAIDAAAPHGTGHAVVRFV